MNIISFTDFLNERLNFDVTDRTVVYTQVETWRIPHIFKDGFVRDTSGTASGNMLGPGIYTSFDEQIASTNYYGNSLIKCRIFNIKDSLCFIPDIAKQIYGKRWRVEDQLRMKMGKKYIQFYNYLSDINKSVLFNYENNSNAAKKAYELGLFNYFKNIIYSGDRDRNSLLCLDYQNIWPIEVVEEMSDKNRKDGWVQRELHLMKNNYTKGVYQQRKTEDKTYKVIQNITKIDWLNADLNDSYIQSILNDYPDIAKKSINITAVQITNENDLIMYLSKYKRYIHKSFLLRNAKLTSVVIQNCNDAYDFRDISKNSNLTLYDIEKYKNKLQWHYITKQIELTPENIEKYKEFIDWEYATENIELTDEIFEKYYDYLNWEYISEHEKLSCETIELYKSYIIFYYLSANKNITNDVIDKFKNHLDWNQLSENIPLSINNLEKYKDYLNWKYITQRIEITPEIFEKFKDYIDWDYISQHVTEMPKIIDMCKDYLNWYKFSDTIELSDDFLEKYKDYIKWIMIKYGNKLTSEQKEKYKDYLK